MTQEQLQDALGMIDDDLIESVDKLRQEREASSHSSPNYDFIPDSIRTLTDPSNTSNGTFQCFRKKLVRREIVKWGSLAASVCLLVGVGFLWTVGSSKTAEDASGSDNYYSIQDNIEDICLQEDKNTNPEVAAPTKPETSPLETLSATADIPYPSLSLSNKDMSFDADFHQIYWFFTDAEGMTMWVNSESIHPLDREDCLVRLNTSLPFLNLQFKNAPSDPEHITVHYWGESCWGNHSAEFQTMAVENGQIHLLEGGYIYEIVAQWGPDQGTMSYCFYAHYSPDKS